MSKEVVPKPEKRKHKIVVNVGADGKGYLWSSVTVLGQGMPELSVEGYKHNARYVFEVDDKAELV